MVTASQHVPLITKMLLDKAERLCSTHVWLQSSVWMDIRACLCVHASEVKRVNAPKTKRSQQSWGEVALVFISHRDVACKRPYSPVAVWLQQMKCNPQSHTWWRTNTEQPKQLDKHQNQLSVINTTKSNNSSNTNTSKAFTGTQPAQSMGSQQLAINLKITRYQ